ncbi:hypothetical protein [Streptomyces xanthophaeus]|uniref:hypothetical protein n=1 Tax=Streptomyces xanthophaeus TaxID=67385 RepID=UPI003F4D3BFE
MSRRTADAVSPAVSHGEVVASLAAFGLVYALLAVVEGRLMATYVMAGPPEPTAAGLAPPRRIGGADEGPDRPMAFSYRVRSVTLSGQGGQPAGNLI